MASRSRRIAASNSVVEETVCEVKGNAVDLVVAAVFAACARHPGVLLGPVQLLIGGIGAGLHAIDGRVRQPGQGVPRPRGFLAEEEILLAARVGVPLLPGALAVALALSGSLSFLQALAPSLEIARPISPVRYRFLKQLGQLGPSALTDKRIGTELVAAAGRLAGGLVTLQDLRTAQPVVADGAQIFQGERTLATVPWGAEAVREADAPLREASHVEMVAASDRRGLMAIACYEVPAQGLVLESFDLLAPLTTEPVRRGVPRVRPGTPLPCAAPILLSAERGVFDLALGVVQSRTAEAELRQLVESMAHTGIEEAIAAFKQSGAGGATPAEKPGYALGLLGSKRLSQKGKGNTQ